MFILVGFVGRCLNSCFRFESNVVVLVEAWKYSACKVQVNNFVCVCLCVCVRVNSMDATKHPSILKCALVYITRIQQRKKGIWSTQNTKHTHYTQFHLEHAIFIRWFSKYLISLLFDSSKIIVNVTEIFRANKKTN